MTQISVASFNDLTPLWTFGGATCTLRLYYTKQFVDSLGNIVLRGSLENPHQTITCNISSQVITIPPITLKSTEDGTPSNASLTGVFFDNNEVQRTTFFSKYRIPVTTPTTWDAIFLHNQPSIVLPDGYYNKVQTELLISEQIENATASFVTLFNTYNNSLADAIAAIGSTATTLIVDQDTSVSTALIVPDTLILDMRGEAMIVNGGGGSIEFEGIGLTNPDSQIPCFSGFDKGDITFTGTVYPKEISLELWDTASTSLTDRIERAAGAFTNQAVKFIAYPRVITGSVELFDWQSLHFRPGEYTNTATGYPSAFPPFLLNDHCGVSSDLGAIIYESDSPNNAHLFAAKMMVVAGADGTVDDLQIRDLHIKGDPSQTHNGQSSTIILGNATNSSVRNVILDGTHAYGVTIGGFATAGNYAEDVDVSHIRTLNTGTQLVNVINGKNITFRDFNIDVRNHNATGSFACIDIEPNTTDTRAENITVENVFIDARTTIPGFVINGVTAQAANAPTLINPVIRDITVLGRDISTNGASGGFLSNGVVVVGAIGGVVENVYVQSPTQQALFVQNSRYLQMRNINVIQCNSSSGFAVELEAVAESDIDSILLNKSFTPYTQFTNIREGEVEWLVTSSGSTITETAPGGNPRFYTHITGLTLTLNANDYIIDVPDPTTFSTTTTTSVGTLAVKTFASSTDVNTGTDTITIASHGHNTGSRVRYTAGTAAVGGLTSGTTYFVISVTAGTLKLASTLALALAGTPIDLTSTGTGTQTLTPVAASKFSSNRFSGNKASDGITLSSTGSSIILDTYDDRNITSVADTNATATTASGTIVYTSLTAGRTVNLPDATICKGKEIVVKDGAGAAASFNITIDGNGSQTIDGAATNVISTNWGKVRIKSNGANWIVI